MKHHENEHQANDGQGDVQDDPLVTAYALGELDEAAARELERALEADTEARADVDELRALAGRLEAAFGREAETGEGPVLQPAQRAAIYAAAGAAKARPKRRGKLMPLLALAASAVLLVWVAQVLGGAENLHRLAQTAMGEPGWEPDPGAVKTGRSLRSESLPDDLRGLGYVGGDPELPRNLRETGYAGGKTDQDYRGAGPLTAGDAERLKSLGYAGSAPSEDLFSVWSPDSKKAGGLTGNTFGFSEPDHEAWYQTIAKGMGGEPSEGRTATPSNNEVVAVATPRNEALRTLGYSASPSGPTSPGPAANSPGPPSSASGAAYDRRRKSGYHGPGDTVPPGGGADEWFMGQGQSTSPTGGIGNESYERIIENAFQDPRQEPRSTFSIDVDTASYANVRRFLMSKRLPPQDAVRIEELVNYFRYDLPNPDGAQPFSTTLEVADCPWDPRNRLVRIALQGRRPEMTSPKPKNLVFLLDVSGSMNSPDKLPLLKRSLRLLLEALDERDRVAIVTYAGNSGLALPSTSCEAKNQIAQAIDVLTPGGSTHGSSGIELAYRIANENFLPGGVNRVILATDGDFNVGVTSRGALHRLIEEKAKTGVFLSVLGFGTGNLKDSTMELLADKGNGNYSYIDSLHEANKVLVREMEGTLETIAKDVKIQIEFNPARVASWRLVGYENRLLAHQDFADDTKDAGEIGAGHAVTALYEIVPAGLEGPGSGLPALKYQTRETRAASTSNELLTCYLRYKEPDGHKSKLLETSLTDPGTSLSEASSDFRFAAAVAGFGLLLRRSPHARDLSFEQVYALAEAGAEFDPFLDRQGFLQLVTQARTIGH